MTVTPLYLLPLTEDSLGSTIDALCRIAIEHGLIDAKPTREDVARVYARAV